MSLPSTYSEECALAICERHAQGESLTDICKSAGMPKRPTVYKWLAQQPDFEALLQCARDELADKLRKEVLEIADGIDPDKKLEEKLLIEVAKVRIDTRKALLQALVLTALSRKANRQAVPQRTVTINIDHEE